METASDRVIDWRAPQSMKYILEANLNARHPVAIRDEHPYTGTVLRCEGGRVVHATAFVNGSASSDNPFPLIVERESISPTYCKFPGVTNSRGDDFEPAMVSENESVPFIDGRKLEGMLMFVYPSATVMSSFSRIGLAEHLWLQDDFALEYKGIISPFRETAQTSEYLWDENGWIEEYSYTDNIRGEHCELRTGSDSTLRGLDVFGRTTLYSDLARHKFERFGSLRRIEQLEGLSFGDYFSLRGDGLDEQALNYLQTLLANGKPKNIRCELSIHAHPHVIARFLAAVAEDIVSLIGHRQLDSAVFDTVRDELRRLRPDLSIEDR